MCIISRMVAFSTVLSVLTAEPLALDLMNTHLFVDEMWVDLLDDPGQRTRWLAAEAERLGIGATDVAACTDEGAAELKAVRAHIAAAIECARSGREPSAQSLAGLNDTLRAAPAVPQVRWDGTAVAASEERPGSLGSQLAARFAEAAAELLAGPAIRKVRRCEGPACAIRFLPRNPNRRWCSPSVCGNRARVARYYLRHKDDSPATPHASAR